MVWHDSLGNGMVESVDGGSPNGCQDGQGPFVQEGMDFFNGCNRFSCIADKYLVVR